MDKKVFNLLRIEETKLGKKLGSGTQGSVFTVSNNPDKVFKLSYLKPLVRFDVKETINKRMVHYALVMNFLSQNKVSCFPKIYKYGINKIQDEGGSIVSWSLQEKLFHLSKQERMALDYLSYFFNKRCDIDEFYNIFNEKISKIDLPNSSKDEILNCYKYYYESPIEHNDIHYLNFMKDSFGNFKLIDFDYSTFREGF